VWIIEENNHKLANEKWMDRDHDIQSANSQWAFKLRMRFAFFVFWRKKEAKLRDSMAPIINCLLVETMMSQIYWKREASTKDKYNRSGEPFVWKAELKKSCVKPGLGEPASTLVGAMVKTSVVLCSYLNF
jgi:hypothetical protein